jgi:hypothetical protein
MKSKALLTAVLLAATNFAWAQGGITPDNFEQNYGVATVDTNHVSPFSSDNSYVDVSGIGKPSTGPAYRGQSSSNRFVFDLNEIGKPSSGPAYNGAS